MSNKIKFTEEELKRLKEIASTLERCIFEYGQLHIEKKKIEDSVRSLKKYENELDGRYLDATKQEESFLEEITKKYGEGGVDINTGEFIPSTKN